MNSIRRVTIYRLAIPLRGEVSHAAAARRVSEPILVKVELTTGTIGFGETHPRDYVTGETAGSVFDEIKKTLLKPVLNCSPDGFFHALSAIDELPVVGSAGQPIPAARAAVELALLDVFSRRFQKPVTEAAGWLGLRQFGAPGSIRSVRFSGVIAKPEVPASIRQVRKMRFFGLRSFKLKVGYADDDARVRQVARVLHRLSRRNPATLRLDANGAWSLDEALVRLDSWRDLPLASVEQPLPKGSEADLPRLASKISIPIMHDESLTSIADAVRLHESGVGGGFNIRLSKCGGFLSSLRLAEFAARHGFTIQLGCMVGETAILSAAGIRFLEVVPNVKFAEGSFGRFLLRQDVAKPSIRFGYGGRVPRLKGLGWGVNVDEARLESLSLHPPEVIELG